MMINAHNSFKNLESFMQFQRLEVAVIALILINQERKVCRDLEARLSALPRYRNDNTL